MKKLAKEKCSSSDSGKAGGLHGIKTDKKQAVTRNPCSMWKKSVRQGKIYA